MKKLLVTTCLSAVALFASMPAQANDELLKLEKDAIGLGGHRRKQRRCRQACRYE